MSKSLYRLSKSEQELQTKLNECEKTLDHFYCFLSECSMWCKENKLTDDFSIAIKCIEYTLMKLIHTNENMNDQPKPKLYKVINWDNGLYSTHDLTVFNLTLDEATEKCKELEAKYPNLTFHIFEMQPSGV